MGTSFNHHATLSWVEYKGRAGHMWRGRNQKYLEVAECVDRRVWAVLATPVEFGHSEDRFQGATRSVARAIGEEESKKSTRLSERPSNLVE